MNNKFIFISLVIITTGLTVLLVVFEQPICLQTKPCKTCHRDTDSVDGDRTGYAQTPLLVLFTTFRDTPEQKQVHKNVLRNWMMFQPYVQPLLFDCDTSSDLITFAKDLGWKVLPAPRVSEEGIPYFKDMFWAAKQSVPSIFYGFSNGDILYDNGLVQTLLATLQARGLTNPLITGIRTNFKHNNGSLFRPVDVRLTALLQGRMFTTWAEDYFIMYNNSYPWEQVPDVVIGRRGYDNFIIGLAIKNNVAVIDATQTILALHQTGLDGDFAGKSPNLGDTDYNIKLLQKFDFTLGLTHQTPYESSYSTFGSVQIWRRNNHLNSWRYRVQMNISQLTRVLAGSNTSRAMN